jgi:hypothetical protein
MPTLSISILALDDEEVNLGLLKRLLGAFPLRRISDNPEASAT